MPSNPTPVFYRNFENYNCMMLHGGDQIIDGKVSTKKYSPDKKHEISCPRL